MKRQINILAYPKCGDIRNPNLHNLNNHLDNDAEVNISEFNLTIPFFRKFDIFHLHWPDVFFDRSVFKTMIRILYFITLIFIFKFRRTKLIWTIHNLQPHQNHHPEIFRQVMRLWTRLIDGYIVMSEESNRIAQGEYPALKQKKFIKLYHATYDCYPNDVSRAKARKKLGVGLNKKVLLSFGIINEYKNIPLLIEEFLSNVSNEYILIIAGSVPDKGLKKKIRSFQDKKIFLSLFFIQDDELQYYFNAADLIVLPFKKILNSGSAMLALSFNKPILCPDLGSLKELSEIFGHTVVNTYDQFSLGNLDLIFENMQPPSPDVLDRFLSKNAAVKLKKFYLSL